MANALNEYYREGYYPSVYPMPKNTRAKNNKWDNNFQESQGMERLLKKPLNPMLASKTQDTGNKFRNALNDINTFYYRNASPQGALMSGLSFRGDMDYNEGGFGDFLEAADDIGGKILEKVAISAGAAGGTALGGPLAGAGGAGLVRVGQIGLGREADKLMYGKENVDPYTKEQLASDAIDVGLTAGTAYLGSALSGGGGEAAKEAGNMAGNIASEQATKQVATEAGSTAADMGLSMRPNAGNLVTEQGKSQMIDNIMQQGTNEGMKKIAPIGADKIVTDQLRETSTPIITDMAKERTGKNVLGSVYNYFKDDPENVSNAINTGATLYQVGRGVKAINDANKMEAPRVSPGKDLKWEDISGYSPEAEASFKEGVDKSVATRRRYDEVLGRDSGNQTMAETVEAERKFAADKANRIMEAERLNKQGRLNTEMQNRNTRYKADLTNAKMERENEILKSQLKSQAQNAIAQSVTNLGQSYVNNSVRKQGEIDNINYMLASVDPTSSPQQANLYQALFKRKMELQ